MYNKILATNDVSMSMCRTKVTKSSWKRVSHRRFTCKCKGKTWKASMVNTYPMSCEARSGGVQLARHTKRASMVNTSHMSCEARSRRVCINSLQGNVPWQSFVME